MPRPLPVVVVASLVYTALLFVSALCYAAAIIIASAFLPAGDLYGLARSWARLQLGALKLLCGLDYTVEGLERIPAGCHVSLWKHSSAWETIAQMVIFPPQAWVLKRELMWLPLVGWATRLLKPIAINRRAGGTAVAQIVSLGRERLASGLWVLVFPEGTRVPVGTTGRFGVSGALLAAEAGCLVVPVAHNAGLYWGRRALFKRPGRIRVVIGAPIATAGRDPREVNDEARAWIEREVRALGA